MKKLLVSLLATAFFLTACGADKKDSLKVGMITDQGTIEDKSFNQGTWEGIKQAAKELGVSEKYQEPATFDEAGYLQSIDDLTTGGHTVIVTPGYNFQSAIYTAQEKYPNVKFIAIDFVPTTADFSDSKATSNTVSVLFAEHESGFLAGVAAALQMQDGAAGFIGGMEVPAVQKFNWGFQQGVAYANEHFNTSVTIAAKHVTYVGDFNDSAAGQQLASTMYSDGVKAIFVAAGGSGVGAITEAKTRANNGENVWIIGVDGDQYDDGIINNGKSVIITSAMKYVDQAAFDSIKSIIDDKFAGGTTVVMDVKSDGVGIPKENPNLTEEIMEKVDELYNQIKDGSLVVKGGDVKLPEGLIK